MNSIIIGGIGGADLNSIPGSVTRQCAKCNGDLTISPSSLKTILQHPDEGFDFMCMPCFQEMKDTITDEHGNKVTPTYGGLSQESIDEVQSLMRAKNYPPEKVASMMKLIATLQENPELLNKLVLNMQAEEIRSAKAEDKDPPVINLDDLA